MSIHKTCGCFVVLSLLAVPFASADQSGLIQTDADFLSPLQTLTITVYDANDFCEITVTNPVGVVHTFSGQVQDNQATASYVPSYLPGTYEIFAQTTGPVAVTETDTFQVIAPSDSLSIENWQCDASSYVPGQNLTFTFDMADSSTSTVSGLSSQLSDSRGDSTAGRLSILRKIVNVAEDGTATARLFLFFDTTGSWSNIYAGTEIRIGLYNMDGSAPLAGQIFRSTGFENNDGSHLSALLTDTLWTVHVDTGFSGNDKIAYLDFEVPPTHSISDILISVNHIKYNYNTGWNDRIYIRENYINTPSSGMVLSTGSTFSSLGRFPIYLPMTPNENGLLYYGIHTDQTIGETQINNGSISESDGTYTNVWQWEDYIDTTADFYIYADKWGYAHDHAGPIELTPQGDVGQSTLVLENFTSDVDAYFPGEPIDFSFSLVSDAADPITGFTGTLADPVPNTTAGGMYILRKFIDAQPDGSSTGRLYLYFDTTGQWSNIYAPTAVEISLYDKDGTTPLTGNIGLTTGFLNNDDNALSSTLAGNEWTITVAQSFTGADKISYLDFAFPPEYSVSDVVFSVDHIIYYCNRSWADTINITTASTGQGSFPLNLNGVYEFTEDSSFSGLGKFPIKLSLNPKTSGFIFYGLDCPDIPENNINHGSLSSNVNEYHNNFTWTDHLHTTAQVFAYADGWQYDNHAVAGPVTIAMDDTPRELGVSDYALDNRGYTLNDTRQMSLTIDDGLGNPQNNLTFKESVSNSNNGKLSIVTQNIITDPDGHHIVRLLMYFDTTGSWSDIYGGTQVKLSVFGPDGKTGIPTQIQVVEGSENIEGYITSTLTETGGLYSWTVDVPQSFTGADRQVWLDFVMDEPYSASQIVYSVDRIKYYCNRSWADSITIKNVTIGQNSFPTGYFDNYLFDTGYKFGSLGKFPLYLSLNPGVGSIFPKMISSEDTILDGSMSVSNGRYTYSHYMDEPGKDYETKLCVSRYGYINNECRCSDSIMLLFTGEPRYLGGLDDEPIMLGDTWQKDLHEYFFVEVDYNNVEYTSTDPNILITDNIATFSPISTDDTVENIIVTARSKTEPNLVAWSDPFTLYAADCMTANDCSDAEGRPVACIQYQCQAFDGQNSYHSSLQGVDLSVFNNNVTISDPFPDPNETVTICAEIFNTGTTNIFDVVTNFYLDDVNSSPIDSNSVTVLPTTYMDLPFRSHQACIQWTVPEDYRGQHRIWVEVSGRYPLDMQEDMLSNNYATVDFFVNDPDMTETDPAVVGNCPLPEQMMLSTSMELYNSAPQCQTITMLIPIKVQVCENETICGPVTGIELGYWDTLYWPSWSGYCREYGVPQEAITDFIRTYEKIWGLGSQGAGSSLPSLTDIPGLFEAPGGWGDGWLPCHPEPTLFWPNIMYSGVMSPGCGGLCPISAWDCGEGVQFQPRFSSPFYNAYEFRVSGRARTVTRCQTEADYIEVPYQICYTPGDTTPITIPFSPFEGGPGGPGGCCYGPNGPGGPSSGPGGTPPIRFTISGPPIDIYGNPLPFEVSFCSSETTVSNEIEDFLMITPDGGLPEAGILLQPGWNQFAPLMEPLDEIGDRRITLKQGWNFFGFSSMTPLLWIDAVIENGIEEKLIEQAHDAGWIQGVIYTLDHSALLYQYVPGDDDFLRNKRAYWLYAAQSGLTLKLPDVGGSQQQATVSWDTLQIVNGAETKPFSDAAAAGWIDSNMYSIDPNNTGYITLPQDVSQVHAWNGYWLRSNLPGLRLLTTEQQQAQVLFDQPLQPQFVQSEPVIEMVSIDTEIGMPAPDFSLPDMDGNRISLSQFAGKDVLLIFGNAQCPFCSKKIPLLNQLQQEGSFEVIYVMLGTTSAAAKSFAKEKHISFTVLIDSNQLVGRTYGIHSIPEAFAIDPEGVIQLQTITDGQVLWYLLEGKEVPNYF